MSFAEPDALWLLALAPLAAASATWLWRRRITDVRAWAAPALWTRLNLAISRGTLIASLATLTLAVKSKDPAKKAQVLDAARAAAEGVEGVTSVELVAAEQKARRRAPAWRSPRVWCGEWWRRCRVTGSLWCRRRASGWCWRR